MSENVVDSSIEQQQDNNIAQHYAQKGRIGFLKDNPGRPVGAKNHSTRVREALLAQVGRQAIARFKHRLNKSSNPKDFEKALDQVIALIGPKALVSLDQSQHTHFTVIVPEPNAGE